MKQFVFYGAMLLLASGLASCEKAVIDESGYDKDTPEVVERGKTRVVSMAVTKQAEPIENGVSLRAPLSEDVIYGVNVYEKKEGTESYVKYAYGLFTDPSKIEVEMYEGYKYKVECLAIQADKDKLYQTGEGYLLPFTHGASKQATMATNEFVISSEENLDQLTKGDTQVGEELVRTYPSVVKYYGILEDIDPKTNTKPTINLKRTSFAINFSVARPKEGELKVEYLNGRFITIDANFGEPKKEGTLYFAFDDIAAAYQENYTQKVKLHLTWTRSTDKAVFESEKEITLACNKVVNLSISVDNIDPTRFMMVLDNSQMVEEKIEWHLKAPLKG